MDVVLIILGVLGLGAIVIAAYVFTVAARNYVSNDINAPYTVSDPPHRGNFTIRERRDRRRGAPVKFPLTLDNVVITRDRRKRPDRRATV